MEFPLPIHFFHFSVSLSGSLLPLSTKQGLHSSPSIAEECRNIPDLGLVHSSEQSPLRSDRLYYIFLQLQTSQQLYASCYVLLCWCLCNGLCEVCHQISLELFSLPSLLPGKKNPVLIFNPSLWYYFTQSPFAVTLGDGDYHSQTQIKLTKLTSDLE